MVKLKITPQRFSEFFGLKANQDDLEFLDIYADQDIPLFLDPYGVSAINSKWSRDCENNIATYFQYLIDSIKIGDSKAVKQLLNAFHEVDEIALGYSSGIPGGRGIGPIQAKQIQEAFENSEAARSGDIKDIADCALLIHGISRDKISDITANILKSQLIEFTQKECKKHSIPLKRSPVSNVFNFTTLKFTSIFQDLPVINGRPKILLPVSSVRQDPELSKDKFYRKFVLEFLKAEHCHAGDSLSYVLKNGKVVIRIKDLKEFLPLSTKNLYQFTKEHPQVLEKYKAELRRTATNKESKAELNPIKRILTPSERIQILNNITPGNDEATNFHKISYNNLIYIFGERLSNPNSETPINEGRKRIDIVFDNTGKIGFFYNINTLHHIQCPKIFVECKNYGREIGNPEIDQLQTRFSDHRGRFGILLCRSILNKKALLSRCKDVLHDNKSFIVVLDDSDISVLLNLKADGNENGVDDFMTKKLSELIM